jgi:dihydrofolate reductase
MKGHTMAKLIYSATMSLDGYIAGPHGDMSWLTDHLSGDNPTADRLLADIGAILAGNRTFTGDDPHRGTDQEGAFGGRYHGPVFVLTHHPSRPAAPGVTLVGDLATAVAKAKDAAGDRYVNILGADVAKQCITAGLLDEILMFVAPVLLGDGVRMFDHPGGTKVPLTPMPGEVAPAYWYRLVH